MEDDKKSIEKLNHLLQKNIDAEKTYSKAAEEVKSSVLQHFFNFQASKRSKFATELKTEILGLGGTPVESSSVKNIFENILPNLASKKSTAVNEEATLKACLAADKDNLEAYKEVIALGNVKTAAKDLLENHRNEIENTLSKIKNLEDVTVEFG